MRRKEIKKIIVNSSSINKEEEYNKILKQVTFSKTERKKSKASLLLPFVGVFCLIGFSSCLICFFNKESNQNNTMLGIENKDAITFADEYFNTTEVLSYKEFFTCDIDDNYSFYIYKVIEDVQLTKQYYYQLFATKELSSSYKVTLTTQDSSLTINSSLSRKNIMDKIEFDYTKEIKITTFKNDIIIKEFSFNFDF